MKNIKLYESFLNEKIILVDRTLNSKIQGIITKYDELWGDDTASKFIDVFESSDVFDNQILDYILNDNNIELLELTDDELLEKYWSSEDEVEAFESATGVVIGGYIDANDWCDFYNALIDAEW
jgi:hypothetical protein